MTARDRSTNRRGQIWTVDYTVGLLLFLIALVALVTVLAKTSLLKDSFSDVLRSGDAVSEQLMGTGYPADWRSDDVLALGILTGNELSQRKTERLLALSQEDYDVTKRLLNTQYEYAFTLSTRNGTLVPILDACVVGSPAVTETKSAYSTTARIAYYTRDATAEALLPALSTVNATLYTNESLSALFASIETYAVVILEEPRLSTVAVPYDGQKAAALKSFVEQGGTLLLIGNVSLPELYGLGEGYNLTFVAGHMNASGTALEEPLLNLTNASVPVTAGFSLNMTGMTRQEPLVSFNDTAHFAGRFTDGDGAVLYLGSLDGTNNATGETVLATVAAAIVESATVPTAECDAVELPLADARQLVTVKRFVAQDGEIRQLTLYVWEEG